MKQHILPDLRFMRLLLLPVLALSLGACATLRTDVVRTPSEASKAALLGDVNAPSMLNGPYTTTTASSASPSSSPENRRSTSG